MPLRSYGSSRRDSWPHPRINPKRVEQLEKIGENQGWFGECASRWCIRGYDMPSLVYELAPTYAPIICLLSCLFFFKIQVLCFLPLCSNDKLFWKHKNFKFFDHMQSNKPTYKTACKKSTSPHGMAKDGNGLCTGQKIASQILFQNRDNPSFFLNTNERLKESSLMCWF